MTNLLIRLFIKDKEKGDRHQYGVMAGIVGICCNLLLAVFKIITGILTGAVSIATDAVNNSSDAVSSIITLVGFKISGKPADREHPYGHGRVEYITGFIVAAAVIAVALTLLKESVSNIFNPTELDVSISTLVVLVVSIGIKIWMSLFYGKIAKKISSEAMRATAADSRADCITTGVALLSVLMMLVFNINVDGYAGAIVSLFVIWSGIKAAGDTLKPLLGSAPDKELIEKIEKEARSHEKVLGVHDIRVHEYGHDVIVASGHIEVPYDMSLVEAHEMVDCIEKNILSLGLVTEMTFHVDPVMTDDEEMIDHREKILNALKALDPKADLHDFRMIHAADSDTLIFEILVPYEVKMTDDELRAYVSDKKLIGDRCECKIIVDRE